MQVDAETLPIASCSTTPETTQQPLTSKTVRTTTKSKRRHKSTKNSPATVNQTDEVTTKSKRATKRAHQDPPDSTSSGSLKKLVLSMGVNHDHDDYTKKVEVVTAISDSETSSVTSTTTMASCSTTVTEGQTTPSNKYKIRREKNNVASRRSRQTRKQKFVDMEDRSEILEKENAELRKKIDMMEALAKSLKQHLVSKMVAK